MSIPIRPSAWKLLAAAAWLVASSSANAQVLRERDLGVRSGDGFGYACANVGDVDRDGIDDFIVGSPYYDNGSLADAGQAVVYSGSTGGPLRVHYGSGFGDNLGESVASAGDVDADGVPDYVVGAPYHDNAMNDVGLVVVYSGSTGAEIWSKDGSTAYGHLGISVSGIGDVDGDGESDVISGSQSNEVYVLGHLGGTIHHLTNPSPFGFGLSVCGCGDVDGDGVNDFLVGEPYADLFWFVGLGAVVTYSGAGGWWLNTMWGTNPGDYLGSTLAMLGDVNGDGTADFIAGGPASSANGGNSGIVRVASGGGATIREQPGDTAGEYYGSSVTGMGDVDGDGVSDYAVGAIRAGSGVNGRVRICSGADGATIYEWYGVAGKNANLGSSVASGDWNGDGVADLLSADSGYYDRGLFVGAVDVELLCPAWWSNYGTGWAGKNGIPSLTSARDPEVGAPIDVDLGNSLGAATTALLFVGLDDANLPLGNNGTLLVTPLFTLVLPVAASGLTLSDTLPDDPALYFVDVYLQALEVDQFATKGLSFTPGLRLHCGYDLP